MINKQETESFKSKFRYQANNYKSTHRKFRYRANNFKSTHRKFANKMHVPGEALKKKILHKLFCSTDHSDIQAGSLL